MARKTTGSIDANSRLAEIFEFQRQKGRGTLGALGGAVGGRVLESLDIRNLLFGGPGTESRSLTQAVGRGIFGRGYRAAPSRRSRGVERDFERPIESPEVIRSLSNMEDSLSSISNKMSIVAKNSIAQNRMSRDINVIRQNVGLLTKKELGTARTKADMYFMNAKQREKEYERQFKKEDIKTTPGAPGDAGDKKESSLASRLFKTALGIGGIFAVIKGIQSIVNGFTSIKSYIENFSKEVQARIQQFKEFDFKNWIESFTPEKMTEFAQGALESLKTGFQATKDAIMGAVDKIDSATIGDTIMFFANSFVDVMKFIFKTFQRGIESLSSEDLLKLAAAGGLYAILFGGAGAKLAGGLIGNLLSSVFSGIVKGLPSLLAVLMSPGGLLAVALGGIFVAAKEFFEGRGAASDAASGAYQTDRENKRIEAEDKFVQGMKNLYPNRSEEELRQGVRSLAESELQQANIQLEQMVNPKQSMEAKLILQKNLKDKFDGSFGQQEAPKGTIADRARARRAADGGKVVQPKTSGASAPPTPEKVEESTSPQSNVLRVQSTPSGMPSSFDYDSYTKRVGYMESGNDYGVVNTIGYAGRYQFGAQALETLGYMKPGSSKGGNKAMRDPSNWTNGLSLEKFLASPEIQDEAMKKLTAMNYKQLVDKGVINSNMSSNELSGWLYVAHGVGAGGAMKFAQGENPAEGYGTTASEMFAKASGMSHPGDSATGFKMSPFSGGASPEIANLMPSMLGGMFASANDKLSDLGDMIINVVNNNAPRAQEAMNEGMAALSSIDINSVKDMLSPFVARTLLTQI
jgi:hypothetical protein